MHIEFTYVILKEALWTSLKDAVSYKICLMDPCGDVPLLKLFTRLMGENNLSILL